MFMTCLGTYSYWKKSTKKWRHPHQLFIPQVAQDHIANKACTKIGRNVYKPFISWNTLLFCWLKVCCNFAKRDLIKNISLHLLSLCYEVVDQTRYRKIYAPWPKGKITSVRVDHRSFFFYEQIHYSFSVSVTWQRYQKNGQSLPSSFRSLLRQQQKNPFTTSLTNKYILALSAYNSETRPLTSILYYWCTTFCHVE